MSYTNLQALQSAISNEMFGSLPSFVTPTLPFPSPGNWTIPKSFDTTQSLLPQISKNPALTGKATTNPNAGLVGFDNRLNSGAGSLFQSLKAGIGNFNNSSISGIASSVATGLRGLTEQDVSYTGKTAEIANDVSDVAENINGMINPLGNAANQVGATIGNLIGGTEDRVKGTGSAIVDGISAVASNFGPIGMAVGTALQLANGIGGKRVDKLQDNTSEIASRTGSAYMGSIGDVQDSIYKYSNKKPGLFDFGFTNEGNSAIDKAEKIQNTMLDIGRYQDLRKSNNAAADLAQQNRNRYSGYTGAVAIGQEGMKLPNLDWAKDFLFKYNQKPQINIPEFQKGGKLGLDTNVIVEGSYHAHKNHLDEINPELGDMTPKGIPVAAPNEDGSKTQVAEIERKELILTKELTDKIEALYKDGSDEAAIEAGMLFADELFNNTQDNTGEVLNE